MRYLSVCSGIEAATVAWHPLGWTAAAYSEIEKFPSQVLAHHYPNTPVLPLILKGILQNSSLSNRGELMKALDEMSQPNPQAAEAQQAQQQAAMQLAQAQVADLQSKAQKQSAEGATTIISELDDAGMVFQPAPGVEIENGIQLINGLLSYDEKRPLSALNAPKLYISDRCQNLIYSLQE